MKNRFFTGIAAAVAVVPLAHAQQTEPAAPPPQPIHHSAFADYRPYQDIEPGAWSALNDVVGAAALKQPAHAGHSTPAASPVAASAPAGQGHAHHPGMQPAHPPMHGGQR